MSGQVGGCRDAVDERLRSGAENRTNRKEEKRKTKKKTKTKKKKKHKQKMQSRPDERLQEGPNAARRHPPPPFHPPLLTVVRIGVAGGASIRLPRPVIAIESDDSDSPSSRWLGGWLAQSLTAAAQRQPGGMSKRSESQQIQSALTRSMELAVDGRRAAMEG